MVTWIGEIGKEAGRARTRAGFSITLMLACSQAMAQSQTTASAGTAAENSALSDEIIVTGTRIRGLDQPVGSSIVEVDRQQIESLSATNFTDVLSQVAIVNSFNTQPRISDVGASASTAPGLRGLPSSATIYLLNGNRMVGDNPLSTSPDPSSIPALAIERVEILKGPYALIFGRGLRHRGHRWHPLGWRFRDALRCLPWQRAPAEP